MLTLLTVTWLVRLSQQRRSDSLVLQTDSFLLRSPPFHELDLSLQLRLLSLYIAQREPLACGLRWLTLQLLDLGEGDRRASRGHARDGLHGR
jgi:hypothetical protein